MKKLVLFSVLLIQWWGVSLQAAEPKAAQNSIEEKEGTPAKLPVSSTKSTEKKPAVAGGNTSSQLDINQANAEQISQGLIGVGKKKAQAIVDYREQYGAFTQLEQLKEVKGIGPSLIERNRGRVKF